MREIEDHSTRTIPAAVNEIAVVVDNPTASRFETTVEEQRCELVYRRTGKRLALIHAGVPDLLAGRGFGGALVLAAVDQAALEGLTIVPACPFVRSWLRKNPDEAARVNVDWTDE